MQAYQRVAFASGGKCFKHKRRNTSNFSLDLPLLQVLQVQILTLRVLEGFRRVLNASHTFDLSGVHFPVRTSVGNDKLPDLPRGQARKRASFVVDGQVLFDYLPNMLERADRVVRYVELVAVVSLETEDDDDTSCLLEDLDKQAP